VYYISNKPIMRVTLKVVNLGDIMNNIVVDPLIDCMQMSCIRIRLTIIVAYACLQRHVKLYFPTSNYSDLN
jgi:hypothetical protein